MSVFGRRNQNKKNGNRELSERTKRYAEWDDYDGEYEDDEYYEDDEQTEYGEDEYYGEEASEYYEDEYYEDGESAEYENDQEYYEEEYYGDDVNYYGDDVEERYESDDDGVLYYMDEGEYEEDDDDEDDFVAYRKKKGVSGALLAFRNLPLIDKVIAFTGVAVLFFAVLTGVVFMAAKKEDKAVAAFADVGTSLKDVHIIGESGLLAVADAQMAKEAMASMEEETQTVEEQPTSQGINVVVRITSIVKDLKIKFVNAETDKLVANVPFEVEVTAPGKKTEVWKDDDKDGVIYKENIGAGAYKVKMVALEGYDGYTFSTETQEAEVKANIAYKKVDVKGEIKTEAEVNAAVEDTANAELVEESHLTDTVPFVKSTQTSGAVSYQEIGKNTIKDPATMVASVRTAEYYLMTSGNDVSSGEVNKPDSGNTEEPKPVLELSTSAVSIKVGEDTTISTTKEEHITSGITWSSSDPSVASVAGGNVKGVAAGTATIKAEGTGAGGKAEATCTVTVTAPAATLEIKPTALSLAVGESGTITANSNQSKIDWTTADTGAVEMTISDDTKTVTVKATKAGTLKLIAKAGGQEQYCTITITDASITLDKTSVQVVVKKTADINVAKTVPENATITEVKSQNTNIATVAVSGKKITVTGVAKGETKIDVKCSNGKTAQVAVTVLNSYETDTTSLLKDKDGNQVYVLENGQYRKAVYADYYKTNIKYYLAITQTVYTGWQNINGKTYYYLENHKFVTGEQVIQGAKYTFASDGSLVTSSGTFGIDVSKWNGDIDWNSVKSSGASYAIIRCGYRGSTTGALITDPKFAANISGANAAGIKVGVYFFTQAVNEKEAVEEASMVLDLVKKYKVSYPIFLDVESSGGRADGIDKGTRTAVCKAFCATIQNSGYTAGVYANKTWLNSKMDAGALGSYKIWLAQYAAAPTYNGRYNLWQYSSKGSVPGIKGDVDLNLSYLGY